MLLLRRSAAVLLTCLVALAGCGGSGSDDTSKDTGSGDKTTTLTAEPADGDTITADDFSYAVPKGWKQARQSTVLSLAVDPTPTKGFRTSINVVSDDTIVGVHGEDLENAVEKALKSINATAITIRDRTMIGGEEGVHSSAIISLNGNEYQVEQYGVERDKSGYFVTFSFSLSIPQAERDKVSESILATWKWKV